MIGLANSANSASQVVKLSGLDAAQINALIPARPVLVGYRGSIAHGMYTGPHPDSIDDKDIMSVCLPPPVYYFGFEPCGFGTRGTHERMLNEWDSVAYELKKFVSLLIKSNPNVLSLLWLDGTHYIYVAPEGQLLIDNRHLFVTKRIYHAFTGYAHGQLHRMTHQAYEGYMGQKRKELVDKNGYDTKNAAHCIRLLRMGIEYLTEGKLYVDRSHTDGPELLEIKRGMWTLDQVKTEAERLFKLAQEVYVRSSLPNEPDMTRINQLMLDLFERRLTNYCGDILLRRLRGPYHSDRSDAD